MVVRHNRDVCTRVVVRACDVVHNVVGFQCVVREQRVRWRWQLLAPTQRQRDARAVHAERRAQMFHAVSEQVQHAVVVRARALVRGVHVLAPVAPAVKRQEHVRGAVGLGEVEHGGVQAFAELGAEQVGAQVGCG